MFSTLEWLIRGMFVFWLGVFGIELSDMALSLHDQAVAAYRKGPISAGQFTRLLTAPASKRSK
jgi:hypothetical protein